MILDLDNNRSLIAAGAWVCILCGLATGRRPSIDVIEPTVVLESLRAEPDVTKTVVTETVVAKNPNLVLTFEAYQRIVSRDLAQ